MEGGKQAPPPELMAQVRRGPRHQGPQTFAQTKNQNRIRKPNGQRRPRQMAQRERRQK